MPAYVQSNRRLTMSATRGKAVLLLVAFAGKEEMSGLFLYELDTLSEDDAIAAPSIVGTNVTFQVTLPEAEPRFFNGFVSRFSAGGLDVRSLRQYRAEVVPWLWFLTRTSDCRIFHHNTAPH